MLESRLKELLAIGLIGDGVLAAVDPERHARLWLDGPRPWRRTVAPFVDHPAATRWLGVAEAALGLWLASRQRAR